MFGIDISILIAAAVALAAWGVTQALVNSTRGDRKRLQQRLLNDTVKDARTSPITRAITLQDGPEGSLSAALLRNAFFQRLNKKLAVAFPDVKVSRFFTLMLTVGMAAFLVVSMVMDSFTSGFFAALGAAWLPVLVVNGRGARRQRTIASQLPEALDFLSRVLRAGHSFSTGLQMMGEELPAPLSTEFRRCYAQHGLGQPLEDSLKDMALRLESSDFAFFVTAVLIQRQTGGDLSEVLQKISAMIRARFRLQQHVKAITAEGRLTSYILVAFPAVLFVISYVLNPEYAGLLIRTEAGRMMLGGAVLLQFIGLLVIRKIVTVKV